MGQGDDCDSAGFAGCCVADLVGHSLGFTQVDGLGFVFEELSQIKNGRSQRKSMETP